MAGYSRQESFSNGDVIDAIELNNEYDQLALAFNEETGHTHDGTVGNGSAIPLIKHTASNTSVNAGANQVTIDISGNAGVFTITRGSSGEAYLNGYNIDNLQTDLDSKYSSTNQPDWDDVQNKPSIAPGLHSHTISEIDGLQTELDEKYSADNPPPAQAAPAWDDVTDKPTTFPVDVEDISKLHYDIVSSTLTREGRFTFVVVTSGDTRTFTLDESTFQIGDIVEIDVLDNGGAVTVVTDEGTIILPDGTNGNSHVLTGSVATIRLYKQNLTNWILKVYA